MAETIEIVYCDYCRKRGEARSVAGLTSDYDTWFAIVVPLELGDKLEEYGFELCSLDCVNSFLAKHREDYEEVQETILQRRDEESRIK